ncbi:MAG: hypothetical protein IJR14_03935 [Synergistaceae bacterium]|nr:hypothetical protein [Synergistaceae bacterium]
MTMKAAKGRGAERVAPLAPRLLDEEGAAAYLGIAATTLRNMRAETPKRFTEETLTAAMEGDHIPPVPYLRIGRTVRYDVRMLDAWIGWIVRLCLVGQLPEDGAVSP